MTQDEERERQDRLRCFQEIEDPGKLLSDFLPGTFGCHEALDRAEILHGLVEDILVSHPAIYQNPEWFSLAKSASRSLFELYQKIGEAERE